MEEQMNLFDMGGLTDDGAMRDPVSGNDVPPGSMASEVRDDVPAMLSEGEYIVPADVVRYYGVKFFEDLRSQAKSGLMSMERNGRIGGEPVGAPEDDLSPEEIQMLAEISGMYGGGMVRKGYAEGGLSDQTFNAPYNYRVPGFSLFEPQQPAEVSDVTETQSVTLYGPNGEIVTLTLPTDQERYNQLLGQGYTTEQKVESTPVQGGESDQVSTAGVANQQPSTGQRDFEGLDPEKYNALLEDPIKFGEDVLNQRDFSRTLGGVGMALSPALGLIGAGAGAGMAAQNIADARAASQIAAARGFDTTSLDEKIESYVSGLPNLARNVSDYFATGDQIANQFFQTARDMGLPESTYGRNPLTRDFFAAGPAGDQAFAEEMQATAPEGMTYNEETGSYQRPEGESAAPTTSPRPTPRPDGGESASTSTSSGEDTNVGNYSGDRDGDGVSNWRDFDDGVGWADTNKDDGSSDSGGSSSGGGCFLTTAVVEMRGEEDDGYTLSTLRKFRDTYLRNKNNEVERYYEVAPKLVRAIPKEDKTWLWIGNRVDKSIQYIEEGKNSLAYQTYKRMVEKLERDWLKEK